MNLDQILKDVEEFERLKMASSEGCLDINPESHLIITGKNYPFETIIRELVDIIRKKDKTIDDLDEKIKSILDMDE